MSQPVTSIAATVQTSKCPTPARTQAESLSSHCSIA